MSDEPAPKRRSREELEMRRRIIAWGRKRYPGARRVEELVIGECRADIAFIQPNNLAVVEIKSSVDTLDRLDKQLRFFTGHAPEVWLAVAPRWVEHHKFEPYRYTHYVLTIDTTVRSHLDQARLYRSPVDLTVTVQMLRILWRDELLRMARRTRVTDSRKGTMRELTDLLARRLTGDQIVTEVCRELRARDEGRMGKAFAGSDPAIPIPIDRPSLLA